MITDGSGSVTAKFSYLPGIDKPHSMRRNGTSYYYGLDHLGGVWGMFEGGGPVANTYHYDPWGNVQNAHESVENPLQFTGREWDAGPGLLYLRNRYYDPSIARFISQDPIGLSGGINPYVYAANSPVLFSDPLGLDDCDKGAAASNKEDACEVSGVGVTVSNRSLLAAFQPSHLSTTGATPGGPKAAGFGRGGGSGDGFGDDGDDNSEVCSDLGASLALSLAGSTVSAASLFSLTFEKSLLKILTGTGGAAVKLLLPGNEASERVPYHPVDMIPFARAMRLADERQQLGCGPATQSRFPLDSGLM